MHQWIMVPVLMLAVIASSGVLAAEEQPAARRAAERDLLETAVAAGQFNAFVAAVKVAGLVDVLEGDGPLTLFIPTDEAFEKLPPGALFDLLKPESKEQLRAILESHIVTGAYRAAELAKRDQLQSLRGRPIEIAADRDTVSVEDAEIVKTDIKASNGLMHVVDTVILPE